jgi:hypothetical protein
MDYGRGVRLRLVVTKTMESALERGIERLLCRSCDSTRAIVASVALKSDECGRS